MKVNNSWSFEVQGINFGRIIQVTFEFIVFMNGFSFVFFPTTFSLEHDIFRGYNIIIFKLKLFEFC